VSRAPEGPQRRVQVAPRAQRRAADVGLRHDEHVGDLHDPALEELQDVARAGLHDHRDGVGDLGDVGLALPDAHRLDDDDVERRRERLRGARVAGARPPRRPPAAVERMNTPVSSGS
jgi:hypothetical protein